MGKRKEKSSLYLELHSVDKLATVSDVEELVLQTNDGVITCLLHPAKDSDAAVVWVGGAGGGLDGPAGGIYPRLARQLLDNNIASFRLHYRYPGYLEECVLDTLLGIEYLKKQNIRRIALVGHSFGGAVVINAGAVSDVVIGVVPMSSQTYGTSQVGTVSPRPLLFMHGTADEILPDACSRDLFERAGEPKDLLLYPGCRHGLDECRHQVDHDLLQWLRKVLLPSSY